MAQNQFDIENAEYDAVQGARDFEKHVRAVMTPSVGRDALMNIIDGKAIEEAFIYVGGNYDNSLEHITITEAQREIVDVYIKEYHEFYSEKYKHL